MPDRIIRAGHNSSKRVDMLSCEAENFYNRLRLVVDDYGRAEYDPEILLAETYPRRVTRYTPAAIAEWMAECNASDGNLGIEPLVLVYRVGNKNFLEVQKFRQRIRSDRGKDGVMRQRQSQFPAPSDGVLLAFEPETFNVFENGTVLVSEGVGVSNLLETKNRLAAGTPTAAAGGLARANEYTNKREEREERENEEGGVGETQTVLPGPVLVRPRRSDFSELEHQEFSSWAEAVYDRHPKKGQKFLALQALVSRFARDKPSRDLFDQNHPLWIASESWNTNPGIVPLLARPDGSGWIADDGWKSPPPKGVAKERQSEKQKGLEFLKNMKEKKHGAG